jgi:lactate permease
MCVGLAQAVTAWGVATLLGPEFPSLLGSVAGFLAGLAMLRTGCLVPREVWRVAAAGNVEQPMETKSTAAREKEPTTVAAFAPYFLLLTLLVLSRSRALPVGGWLSSVSLGMSDILETGISGRFEPLYSPGLIFVVCALVSTLWLRAGWHSLPQAARDAGAVTLQTAVALLSAIVMVRIFIHSGENDAGLTSMPVALAETLAQGLGEFWPAVAPWIGALGSFVSGSATFSNMLFALLQLQVATDLNHTATSILALQGVGAAAGNMVCIHNVVAACAVTGILGEEGDVIRRTALPLVVHLTIAGVLGMLL